MGLDIHWCGGHLWKITICTCLKHTDLFSFQILFLSQQDYVLILQHNHRFCHFIFLFSHHSPGFTSLSLTLKLVKKFLHSSTLRFFYLRALNTLQLTIPKLNELCGCTIDPSWGRLYDHVFGGNIIIVIITITFCPHLKYLTKANSTWSTS